MRLDNGDELFREIDYLVRVMGMQPYIIRNNKFEMIDLYSLKDFSGNIILNPREDWLPK